MLEKLFKVALEVLPDWKLMEGTAFVEQLHLRCWE